MFILTNKHTEGAEKNYISFIPSSVECQNMCTCKLCPLERNYFGRLNWWKGYKPNIQ